MESSALILFFITAISLVGLALVFSSYVPPTSFTTAKFEPYECGMETIGETWNQYTVGYYLFAILFLIFDVETVFIFPWATVMKEVGMTGFVEILIFFGILGLGLFYGWKKHALKWE
jgi:NADH-quinone oxidoreductase subunit A